MEMTIREDLEKTVKDVESMFKEVDDGLAILRKLGRETPELKRKYEDVKGRLESLRTALE